MAKFKFQMQNILSIKAKLEDQAKAEYGLELARLHEEEEKKHQLELRKQSYEQQLRDALTKILDMKKIKQLELVIESIKHMIAEQILCIKKQEQRVKKAQEHLEEAMKERKTYEKLKENAFEDFRKEVSAQEQKEIDELVSFRHGINE